MGSNDPEQVPGPPGHEKGRERVVLQCRVRETKVGVAGSGVTY